VIKPVALFRLRENDEIEALTEAARGRVTRHVQHAPEHIFGDRLLLELANHPSAPHHVSKFHDIKA